MAEGVGLARRTRCIQCFLVVCGLALGLTCAVSRAAEEPTPPPRAVTDNMDISLEYTLTVDGAVVDSTEGKAPFHYTQGKHQAIPGFEKQVEGLHVGDSKEFTVAPEEGYGPIDPAAVVEVSKQQLPTEVTPTAGMKLRGLNQEGRSFQATVKEVKDQSVILDLNHPLAGKTLAFKVKVLDIQPIP